VSFTVEKLMAFLATSKFQPNIFGVLVNPVYIIRRALYLKILELASLIQGNVLDFGSGSKPYENLFLNVNNFTGCDIALSGHCH
jgi:hypothetical protein